MNLGLDLDPSSLLGLVLKMKLHGKDDDTLARAVDTSVKNKFRFDSLETKVELNFINITFSFYKEVLNNQQIKGPRNIQV